MLATHNETATGVKSDIAVVRRALDTAGHPALLFGDGVSSISPMDFRFDEWRVAIAVTGSQNGFMLTAGLATETASLPRTFFDVRDMETGYAANGSPDTPAVGLLNGLNEACKMLLAERLDNVSARHHRIAEAARAAAGARGMELHAVSPDVYSDNLRTAERTAAASYVSIKHLARKDAKVIGMIGAGHQARSQLRAALEQRQFEKVIGWNRHPE